MIKHAHLITSWAATTRKSVVAALAAVCLFTALSLTPFASYADGGARDRKEAISQALARSDAGTSVLGVKRVKQSNGSVIFNVKVINNGRVKVISIPKVKSN